MYWKGALDAPGTGVTNWLTGTGNPIPVLKRAHAFSLPPSFPISLALSPYFPSPTPLGCSVPCFLDQADHKFRDLPVGLNKASASACRKSSFNHRASLALELTGQIYTSDRLTVSVLQVE